MALSKQQVEHVAKLARLGLLEEEKETLARQLSNILDHVEIINQLPTENVEPTTHAIPMKNVMREDEVKPCKNTKDILKNAPDETSGMFKVPRILE